MSDTSIILYKDKEQLRIEYFITQQKIRTNINRKNKNIIRINFNLFNNLSF